MIGKLTKLINGRKLLILGFGREGQSTYRLIREYFPEKTITIADKEETHSLALKTKSSDTNVNLKLGSSYLDEINEHELIFKSPGINLQNPRLKPGTILTSQTQLFLELYSDQTIGITGTKGKSTTSSLIYHLLKEAGKDSILIGNIGIPPFSALKNIHPETIVVFELSAHQLELVKVAPRIAILLNIFEEHLDYFQSFDQYRKCKAKIINQKGAQTIIFNQDQDELHALIPPHLLPKSLSFSLKPSLNSNCFMSGGNIVLKNQESYQPVINTGKLTNLIGQHNLYNVMAATLACSELQLTNEQINRGLISFKSLEHRLEYVGKYRNIHFYNDSISTIPEAAIEAVKSLPETDTLILGGFDRGIHYEKLMFFLHGSGIRNFIFMGPAGKRMKLIFNNSNPEGVHIFEPTTLEEAVKIAFECTMPGKICLLSPAASSYDAFKNFEERGSLYKKIARSL